MFEMFFPVASSTIIAKLSGFRPQRPEINPSLDRFGSAHIGPEII